MDRKIRQVVIAFVMLLYERSFVLGFDLCVTQPFGFEHDIHSIMGCNFKLHTHINRENNKF